MRCGRRVWCHMLFYILLSKLFYKCLISEKRLSTSRFFLQYFEHTWFNTFPPNVYNVSAHPPTSLTINTCEGYNNRFNVTAGERVKPKFWDFLENSAKRKLAKAKYLQYRLGYRSYPPKKNGET